MSAWESEFHLYLEMDKTAKAREALGRAAELAPHEPRLFLAYAHLESHEKDWAAAEALLDEFLRLFPQSREGRSLLAHICRHTQRHGTAERLFVDLMREAPDDDGPYVGYALLLLENHRFAKAEELLKEARRLNPNSQQVALATTLLLVAQGRASSEWLEAQRAFLHSPQAIRATLRMVYVLLDQGKYSAARDLLHDVALRMPDDESLLVTFKEVVKAAHPVMLPLRPFQKHGHARYALFCVAFFLVFFPLAQLGGEKAAFALVAVGIAFVAYTWVAPLVVSLLVKRRYG